MLRCVLDTDVIIAAMRSPTGASAAILQIAADTSQVCLLASVPLALEYEAKCLETRHWTETQSWVQSPLKLQWNTGAMLPRCCLGRRFDEVGSQGG
jgi:predicted nucleic acid-binding protein